MRPRPDWGCWRWARSASRSFSGICQGEAGVRWWISFIFGSLLLHAAGPQDFGMSELNAAIAERAFRIKPKITAELDLNAPETFRIEPYQAGGAHITGGDLRGLMYG